MRHVINAFVIAHIVLIAAVVWLIVYMVRGELDSIRRERKREEKTEEV